MKQLCLLLLALNCLIAEPGPKPAGMFELYAQNRLEKTPNFITVDFLMLVESMLVRDATIELETKQWLPLLRTAIERLETAAGKAGEDDAAKDNRNYLMVMHHLLAGTEPAAGNPLAAEEVAKVRAAAGTAKSAVANQTLDYSQFRPRGHYARTPELTHYFQAVRYAGAVLFYVKESAATGIEASIADLHVRQAALLVQWMKQNPAALQAMERFEQTRSYLFGPAEDLGVVDVWSVIAVSPKATPSAWREALLKLAKAKGRQPVILSAAVDAGRLEAGVTAADALTGWRLIPGSFTPDSAAGQQLTYSRVKKYLGNKQPSSLTNVAGVGVKGFPLAAEIMELLGSPEARQWLTANDETNYEAYAPAHEAAAKLIRTAGAGLPGEYMRVLEGLFHDAPASEQAQAYRTALGFWTLYRHESVLYAKQSYTSVGKGMQPVDERTTAYLEPAEGVYLKLMKLAAAVEVKTGSKALGQFGVVLKRCAAISRIETLGQKLPASEAAFLNDLDHDLSKLVSRADEPIAVDVHTDLNSGQVLVEALGFPDLASRDLGGGALARGARFHPEEFKHPLADRLTDEKWREMINQKERKEKSQ